MKRTTKRRTPAVKRESAKSLRPSGESELSVAEEEMIETLLALPSGKKRKTGPKRPVKSTAKAASRRRPAAMRRSRAGAAKKTKSRKSPKRK